MRKLHLWLAVPFGVVVTLVCLSGAALVFEDEITALCRPELYRVDVAGRQPLPVDRVVGGVQRTLPAGTGIAGVSIPADPSAPWRVNLTQPRRAWVAVNPYTGEVLGRGGRLPFFSFMFRLHRWLLGDAGSVGKTVVGLSTLAFAAALLTGLALWWPRRRGALRHALTVPVRRGLPRFWFGLHNAGGFYACLLLLVMALTGLTWSFGWYRSAFYALFGTQPPQRHGAGGGPSARRDGAAPRPTDFAQWQTVADELRRLHPHGGTISLKDGEATVALRALGNSRATDRYAFDPATGRMELVSRYADAPPADKLRGWIYSVHTGTWGGLVTRALYFLAALLGATLPLTGYYLWWRRLRRRGRRTA